MTFFSFISRTILLGLSATVISSCNQTSDNEKDYVEKVDISKKVVTKIANNDTLIIDKPCAVIVIADSLQIEKRKKELGQDFYVGADDYAFYLNETQKYLDSVKLKTIDCIGIKYLKFVYADKRLELINLTDLDELWKVYFFSPNKKSVSIDMTMIDEEYKKYFK